MKTLGRALAGTLVFLAAVSSGAAQPRAAITIASTTSTEQSGLFKHLLPLFTARTGIEARVVALGTGQAIDVGRRGDADVVFVHDRDAEMKALQEGHFVDRREVMGNDFIVVGPRPDPARIDGGRDVAVALRAIAEAGAPFLSRGDKSGTHAAELRYWKSAGVDPTAAGRGGRGGWYRETGQGMGPVLNTAAALGAYTISDRATWLSFRNRQQLTVLVQGDPRLFNQYGVMLVNPARHPHVRQEAGKRFIDWITSAEGQQAIAAFRIGGEQAFFPNHGKD
jgi:tungstate transport system substrate-binding protein